MDQNKCLLRRKLATQYDAEDEGMAVLATQDRQTGKS